MNTTTKKLRYSNYHAGQFEDSRLRDLWPACPDTGLFVDVGAADGIIASNTYHFEKNGWKGVCIDGNPDTFELLRANRPGAICLREVITSRPGNVRFVIDPTPYLSGLKNDRGRVFETQSVDLTSLLTSIGVHGQIDLLSIDVEGTELDVWRSLDFERYKPKAVIAEYIHETKTLTEFVQHFTYSGYIVLDVNCLNVVFVHGDHYRN